MRRSTLIVLLAIIVSAMVASSAFAGEVNWSAGITLTEKESGVTIGSRIEVSNRGRLVGSWFSSSGQLPVMVEGLEYDAFGDFPGIWKIRKVVLTPDHGKTEWLAELVEGKGYAVAIPRLRAGSYGLEWGVLSHDKRNRLMLIIIPINWSSNRSTSATNHAMVQVAPGNCGGFNDQQWFALLRGFVPAWASFDPAFVAQQNMQSQRPADPPPATAPAPPAKPAVRDDKGAYTPSEPSKVKMILVGNDPSVFDDVNIEIELAKGDYLVFKRDGQFVADAKVTRVTEGEIQARITKGGGVRNGDDIFKKGEK